MITAWNGNKPFTGFYYTGHRYEGYYSPKSSTENSEPVKFKSVEHAKEMFSSYTYLRHEGFILRDESGEQVGVIRPRWDDYRKF
jgi:hypothetical protein